MLNPKPRFYTYKNGIKDYTQLCIVTSIIQEKVSLKAILFVIIMFLELYIPILTRLDTVGPLGDISAKRSYPLQ